jgi:hypothetical protein
MSPSCIRAKAAIAVNTKRAFEEYLDKIRIRKTK